MEAGWRLVTLFFLSFYISVDTRVGRVVEGSQWRLALDIDKIVSAIWSIWIGWDGLFEKSMAPRDIYEVVVTGDSGDTVLRYYI